MSARTSICLGMFSLATFALTNVSQAEEFAFDQPNGGQWTVTIEGVPSSTIPEKDYQKVYNSIPFSRAEFDTNPNYRHEATMEILTGQLRPGTKVDVKVDPNVTGNTFPFVPGFSPVRGYVVAPYGGYRSNWR